MLFSVAIETRRALAYAIRGSVGVEVRIITTGAGVKLAFACFALHVTSFALLSLALVETIPTGPHTFQRHIRACTLDACILCVPAVMLSNPTCMKRCMDLQCLAMTAS